MGVGWPRPGACGDGRRLLSRPGEGRRRASPRTALIQAAGLVIRSNQITETCLRSPAGVDAGRVAEVGAKDTNHAGAERTSACEAADASGAAAHVARWRTARKQDREFEEQSPATAVGH